MPPSNRRQFLRTTAGLTAGLSTLSFLNPTHLNQLEEALLPYRDVSASDLARDENFWYHIQRSFKQSAHFINLENGYMSPQPTEVLDAYVENLRMVNRDTSFYMRRGMNADVNGVKHQLAELAGCTAEELVLTRNTTEALDTVIAGLDLRAGDEAIMCHLDYSSMLAAFDQQRRRVGIINTFIELPLHPTSDAEIVQLYENAITEKTKVILVTHLNNITGMVLPVRKICDMAHQRGVEVICDGAHSFAQLDFTIPELGCDYFGASLHKWLCCPMGAGILYIKKDKIQQVWPLFGDASFPQNDIRKFEHIGITPVALRRTIANAIRFHNMIGAKPKEARLKYLKAYWTEGVRDLPGLHLHTPAEDSRSSALALISVDGYTMYELSKALYDRFRIFTVHRNNPVVKGVRITPHLYTRMEDLDRLVDGLTQLCQA